MLDLFTSLLIRVYVIWLQNGRIPSSVSQGVMSLIRKVLSIGNKISNFRPTTLLNVELKILAKVLMKTLTLVVKRFVREAQLCDIPEGQSRATSILSATGLGR